MVTPVEIQSKVFKSGGLGYDKKDVDAFMREIVDSYENVYRENMELKDKVAVLNQGIQSYKTMEKTMQKALVLAEKTAEETRSNAEKDAKRIEKEATTKANIMLADARNELQSLHQQTIALVQQYEKYKVQFKNLASAQIELLSTDAFNINIERLDAFVSDPENFEAATSAAVKASKPADEVNEITSGTSSFAAAEDDDQDRDFSDHNNDSQEEFDFVDLNEN